MGMQMSEREMIAFHDNCLMYGEDGEGFFNPHARLYDGSRGLDRCIVACGTCGEFTRWSDCKAAKACRHCNRSLWLPRVFESAWSAWSAWHLAEPRTLDMLNVLLRDAQDALGGDRGQDR